MSKKMPFFGLFYVIKEKYFGAFLVGRTKQDIWKCHLEALTSAERDKKKNLVLFRLWERSRLVVNII